MAAMTDYLDIGGLRVERALHDVVRDEIIPGLEFSPEAVWQELNLIVRKWAPRNRALLARRDSLQSSIDDWLHDNDGQAIDPRRYRKLLADTGYIVEEGADFQVGVCNVDSEIAAIAAPQLVVPIDNARYALNAANARWGSLYDALYGTDVIARDAGTSVGYDPVRGEQVIARANVFLDEVLPLSSGTWSDVLHIHVQPGQLLFRMQEGREATLANPALHVGHVGGEDGKFGVLFRHHNLHIEIQVDPQHPIGRQHKAGIRDVLMEAAVSVIMDCEDSVAAVDGEDKAMVYRNWAGLMKGSLVARFDKGGRETIRGLHADRNYNDHRGNLKSLPGRGLMLVRHVGSHVHTRAVTDGVGNPIPETCLDAMMTVLGALHDLRHTGPLRNSRKDSIYIVKPKMHGPEEVALSVDLFAHLEQFFELPTNTLKIGIMDEERRTTLNLRECIRAARDRVIFINTGFLDRTGDEIHTSMNAGPFICKQEIKNAAWMQAYEDHNVDSGLRCGLAGRAQIGKGMWAMPDEMRTMLETKRAQPEAGASCAWVPSPTAATLHAMHYHQVDVNARQKALIQRPGMDRLHDLLTLSLLGKRRLSATRIQDELNNNAQGILGYVVRWVEQGIGCSKVPDIHGVGLMEDRATLRISSQHIANWLLHGVVDKRQVVNAMKRMAAIVDEQNAADPSYLSMSTRYEESPAFRAALDLVLNGRELANGYTEERLIFWRRKFKDRQLEGNTTG